MRRHRNPSKDGRVDEMQDLPRKDLYHPVLLYRWDKKLLFCLCRTCVHEHNAKSECRHLSDAERCLEGTWVIDEVRLALAKGYKILEVLEVYEYEVTCYDPETGNGGHFVDYINTFFKLTLCRPDGLLIKYPQFPDLLNALNVQPHNIFLLTV